MTTKHPRLNITLDDQYMGVLARMARREQKSLSATARDLILQALELQEDHALSQFAAERDGEKTRWRPHDAAWK